jgi:hypothetical protein
MFYKEPLEPRYMLYHEIKKIGHTDFIFPDKDNFVAKISWF